MEDDDLSSSSVETESELTSTDPNNGTNPPASVTFPSQLVRGACEYTCSVCGDSFFTLAQLGRHVLFHDSDRPFPCTICGKRFLSRSHHTEHQRVHTGARPYPCDHCERAFTTHHNLKRHLLIHEKEEAYRCNVCSVLFCHQHQLDNISGIMKILQQHKLDPELSREREDELIPQTDSQLKFDNQNTRQSKKKKKKKHKHLHLKEARSLSTKRRTQLNQTRLHHLQDQERKGKNSKRIQKIAYDIEVVL